MTCISLLCFLHPAFQILRIRSLHHVHHCHFAPTSSSLLMSSLSHYAQTHSPLELTQVTFQFHPWKMKCSVALAVTPGHNWPHAASSFIGLFYLPCKGKYDPWQVWSEQENFEQSLKHLCSRPQQIPAVRMSFRLVWLQNQYSLLVFLLIFVR